MIVAPDQHVLLLAHLTTAYVHIWDRPIGGPLTLKHYLIVALLAGIARWRLVKLAERREARARQGRPGHLDQTRRHG